MTSILEEIKVEECEECSNQTILYDAILNGKGKRLCKKCIATTGAIEIKKPKKIDIQTNKRPSVKQILMKMSGLDKEKESHNLKVGLDLSKSSADEVTLNDIMERRIRMKKEGKIEEEKETKEMSDVKFAKASKPIDFSIKATKGKSIRDFINFKRQRRQPESQAEKKETERGKAN